MSKLPVNIAEGIPRGLLPRGEKILVAVSGGVDSMVLLHALSEENRWRLTVAHLNHCLRGKSSDADERLVVRTAKKLKLPVVVERVDVAAISKAGKLSLEMAARKVRHEFLARTASRLKIRRIALAHHVDDQIELFFLRLLRGSGSEGLAGMKWQSPSPADPRLQLVRPMLARSKEELRRYAATHKVKFREDASNAALDIRRNRIRHELLPLLRGKYQPGLDTIILRLMEILRAESDCLNDAALNSAGRPFGELPVAVQRRRIQVQLLAQGIPADFDLIERLRGGVDEVFCIAPQLTARRDTSGQVHLTMMEQATPDFEETSAELVGKSGEILFRDRKVRWRHVQSAEMPKRTQNREVFDADKVGTRIVLRPWRPGDRFQPIGMSRPVKLQDFFTNQKVPRALRHQLMIATTKTGEIFWIEGLRIGEAFKVTPATRRCLDWRWSER